jgi:hypothetical protein
MNEGEFCQLLGAARCGTTNMYNRFKNHPDIVIGTIGNLKEMQIFSKPPHLTYGPVNYGAYFENRSGVRFEATPIYLFHPLVPKKIKDTIPQARFVVLLRNPIDRTYSQYRFTVRRTEGRLESLTFEQALDAEEDRLREHWIGIQQDFCYYDDKFNSWSYLARSRYAEQIERWFEYFPKDRFLFVKSEDYFTFLSDIGNQVLAFILQKSPKTTTQNCSFKHAIAPINRGNKPLNPEKTCYFPRRYPPMSLETRKNLREYFKPYNQRLYELLDRDFGWK